MISIELAPGFEISVDDTDIAVLRDLGKRVADIGALPVQAKHREMWRRVNDREKDSAAVLVMGDEIPWNEMAGFGELEIKSKSPFAQTLEQQLRRTIFLWERVPCHMVVDPVCLSSYAIMDSGFGIAVKEDLIEGGNSYVSSHRYHPVIKDESDIEKIKDPVVSHNEALTEKVFELRRLIFDGVLDVRKTGIYQCHLAMWDDLVALWGPQELLMDMATRPDFVHKVIARYTEATEKRLDRYEALNLVTREDGNFNTHPGGLGYTNDLPAPGFDPQRVRLGDIWGSGVAQIMCMASPDMHEEFALQYERRLLKRFGLTYYGCCEPLHNRIHLLRSIRNLRKISISPWADIEKAVENIGGDYVLSIKPNPAVFVGSWNADAVRKDIRSILEKTRGCAREIIMKDISTVSDNPVNLFEWARIAAEEVDRYCL